MPRSKNSGPAPTKGIISNRFRQVALNRILPRDDLVSIKISNATPEIIGFQGRADESPCSS